MASDPTAETPPSERLIVTIPGLCNRGFEAWWLRRRLVEASGSPTVVFRYRTVTTESPVMRLDDGTELEADVIVFATG